MIAKGLGRNFRESHFQQFLTVTPGFFLHKWEMRKGRLLLLIDMPADAAQQMENEKLVFERK